MIMLLLSFVFLTDSLSDDSVRIDTLPQVTVRARQEMTIEEAVKNALEREKRARESQPKIPSLGDILQKHAPRLMDQITHPFAFRQRKKEKRQKKHREALEHYDRVKPFEELLREAAWQLYVEDSLKQLRLQGLEK